ncbi:MAG: MFS transporter, partial [Firmicutes bacterium]|nr:MFS transporter [Bacillota bacterium]MCL6564738.1 MFS transporter [Bacillota bacterium]
MAQELPAPLTAISFRVAASLFAAAFVVFANLYDAQPLLPLFRSVFHANEAVVSLAIALSVLGVAAASLLVGPISDRWGRKNLMVLSTFLLALPTFAAAWAPNIETFL